MKTLPLALIFLILLAPFVQAFDTISLTKVDYSSNDATLAGPAWLLSVVENGNNQYATGTFDNTAIKTADGKTAREDLTIKISTENNRCQYTFQNTYTPVYNMAMIDAPSNGFGDWSWVNTEAKCKAMPGYSTWDVYGWRGYCFIKKVSANITPLSTPTTLTKSTISLTTGSSTISGDVTNFGQRSVNLGTQGYATWQGNLVSGGQCPNPLDTGVMGANVNSQLQIIDKASYDAYLPAEATLKACVSALGCSDGSVGTTQCLQQCVTEYNAKSNAVLVKTGNSFFSKAAISSGAVRDDYGVIIGNGQAIIPLSNNVQFPMISLRVKTDFLGIFLPVGKPSITDIATSPFTEGTNGNLRVTVKNNGDGQGAFNIYATCAAGISQMGTSNTLTLNPGESGFVDVPINCKTDGKDLSATCTVIAQDINQPANKDSKDISATCKPLAICTPGDQRCADSKIIQTCNAAGSKWTNTETCPNGCNVVNGKYQCMNVETCSTDAQCDDNDPATADACVGVPGFKHCQHTPVEQTNLTPYIKLGAFALALIIGIILALVGFKGGPAWLGIIGVVLALGGLIGALLGIFALFSALAAWLMLAGLVLGIAGVSFIELVPQVALPLLGTGIICIIIAIAVVAI